VGDQHGGYLCLTAVFADLGGAYPVSGGLQAFARRAFGDFAALEVGYLYWMCAVIGNAAFLTAFVGYLAVLWPGAREPWSAFAVSQALLWTLTVFNAIGVKAGGIVQMVTVVCKVVPLLLLSVALLAYASLDNLEPFAPHGMGSLLPAVSLVSWLFIGMESVTVPAEEIRGAGQDDQARGVHRLRGDLRGVPAGAAGAQPGGAGERAGGLVEPARRGRPREVRRGGRAGRDDRRAGVGGGDLERVAAGHQPHGVRDGARRAGAAPARAAAPAHGHAGVGARGVVGDDGGLMLLYFSDSLLDIYNFIALLSTATALVAIGVACLAEIVLLRREPERFSPRQRRRGPITAGSGWLVVMLMIAGAGAEVILWTLDRDRWCRCPTTCWSSAARPGRVLVRAGGLALAPSRSPKER
jgi:APA family basic amino acid/polyamine antiporter